jgi:hypothetical protein
VVALLVAQGPEQMQRVEMLGLELQNARVEGLGLRQLALLLQRHRLLEQLRGVQSLSFRHAHFSRIFRSSAPMLRRGEVISQQTPSW